MDIKIEKDVPLPLGRARSNEFRVLLERMHPGESFLIPVAVRSCLAESVSQLKRRNKQFSRRVYTIRKQEGGMARCWRVL